MSPEVEMQINAQFKRKFSGTKVGPSEELHFCHPNRLERKLLFHLHQISISAFIVFVCHNIIYQ